MEPAGTKVGGYALRGWYLGYTGFTHHRTEDYRAMELRGHPVYFSPEAAADAALADRVTATLDADLRRVHELLPRAAGARLGKVAFWIEHGNPETPGMTYHPSAQWLRTHGYNPAKAKGVEIGHCGTSSLERCSAVHDSARASKCLPRSSAGLWPAGDSGGVRAAGGGAKLRIGGVREEAG